MRNARWESPGGGTAATSGPSPVLATAVDAEHGGLRVLHVLASDRRRGAESFGVALGAALDGRGYRNRVIALAPSKAQSVLEVPLLGQRPRGLRTLRRLRAAMKDTDLVVAHGSTTLSACVLAGVGVRHQTIYVNIGDPAYWARSRGRRARTAILLRRMAAVAALSHQAARRLRDHLWVRDERIRVIGNGRSAAQFPRADARARAAAREELGLGLDQERPVVVTMGSLTAEKRVDVAIAAIALLPGFELLIVGDGKERSSLERLAARSAPGRVQFLGAVNDPLPVLTAADVILLTSDSEGLPGVLIEAGLVGRAVVATDVGFVSDIVRDGLTGVLVPPDDPQATASAVRHAFEHRAQLGDAAFSWMTQNFELDVIVDRWDALLRTVRDGSAPRRRARRVTEPGTGPLRVLHVIDSLHLSGGAENSMAQTLPCLIGHGIQSRVVALSSPAGQGAEALSRHGIEVVEATGNRLRQFLTLRREIARFRPALVHTTLFNSGVVGRLAAASARVPAVASWVNTTYSPIATPGTSARWKARAVKLAERLLFRHATAAVHALTDAAAQSIHAKLGVPLDRVTVIPRGRDRNTLGEPSPTRRAAVRDRLGLATDAAVLLNVGRQERQKGQVGLIEAFAKIHAQRPDAVLLIAGRPGAASVDIQAGIERHGLAADVRVLGQRDDVPDLLAAADVFVFSSLWEGLGCAVLEAMAMEIPIVSYGVPAVAEVLGQTGLLVPVGDHDALATTVVQALAAVTTLRREQAQAARRRFDDLFAVDRVAESSALWYRSVAASALRRAPR